MLTGTIETVPSALLSAPATVMAVGLIMAKTWSLRPSPSMSMGRIWRWSSLTAGQLVRVKKVVSGIGFPGGGLPTSTFAGVCHESHPGVALVIDGYSNVRAGSDVPPVTSPGEQVPLGSVVQEQSAVPVQ